MTDTTTPDAGSAPAPLTDRYGVPVDATKGDQFTSYDVGAFEVPSHKDEIWRFTPLRRLRGIHDGSNVTASGRLLASVAERDGLTVETVAMDDKRVGEAGAPRDRVAAQAYSSSTEATVITVAKEVVLDEPVYVTVDGPGEGELAYGHTQVRLEPFANATFVVDQRGGGTIAENVEFIVGDSAHLEVVLIQDWDDDALHLAGHHLQVGRDATLTYTTVTFGGEVVRVSPFARFTAPGGTVTLNGLYYADDGQHLEHRLLVDHSVPNCTSRILYKGALQGDASSNLPDAHTVWIGDVLIRAAAVGTDTYEMNRNLVLTDGARADSVPNLEIETGEIAGAGHASAVGRFDEEHLFYLMSRGIAEDVARRLVVRGFFGEVINRIGVPEVRERITEAVELELQSSGI
ncbi:MULTISPECIES: Fe-S cluster assembly protein SufD [Dietzia]|uniref:Fe-S cluster assembly protein SufD n=1 Tax=Dietzia TaxID=37914 RepID=UPI000D090584|nr:MULTISPECIES: Fe-S cluster assembly protein SufD [Dietzia]AVM65317.1 Fe-S cluster assembly protein SufD [Dietzia sp. oral taxon 368]MCT1711074.1 Fe-S cluster assembly protein SufD [Dietzia cinnamea]MCT1884374.1 Fe-S cluster assembly protein SufD [Dietzia cinnamea]MCT2263101.1 Fe-S cluster assembly protein SufD [Dietzia cinnamea]MCT2275387.1 Fe-S cluster assembly protein SufD [Dietzia cinnamea]